MQARCPCYAVAALLRRENACAIIPRRSEKCFCSSIFILRASMRTRPAQPASGGAMTWDETLYGRDDEMDEYGDSGAYGDSLEEGYEEEEEEEEAEMPVSEEPEPEPAMPAAPAPSRPIGGGGGGSKPAAKKPAKKKPAKKPAKKKPAKKKPAKKKAAKKPARKKAKAKKPAKKKK